MIDVNGGWGERSYTIDLSGNKVCAVFVPFIYWAAGCRSDWGINVSLIWEPLVNETLWDL